MAKQKPKYPQAELKKVGMGYDKIGFKNSAIDMIKSKMDKFATDYSTENADIVENLPSSFKSQVPEKRGKDVWQGGSKQWFEPNKRNQLIEDVYEVKGPLTGKKGMSISKYKENRSTLRSYYQYPELDTNKKSGK